MDRFSKDLTFPLDDIEDSPRNEYHGPVKGLLFEVCWELAKKVGGIYTVVRSKALVTSNLYREHYTLVGPYDTKTQFTEFEFFEPTGNLGTVLNKLQNEGHIKYKFGRWLVKGYPRVLLLDLDAGRSKGQAWKNALNPHLPNDLEALDAIVFGNLLALVLAGMAKIEEEPVIAHFHEWMCSVAIILLNTWQIQIATIFTTHATILGRFLSAGKVDFYNTLSKINADKEAGDRGIYAKFWIERAAAHGAKVFTTISDITALEATHLLGKKADVLLPNGLQVEHFEALHQFQTLHAEAKDVISAFVRGHFAGHYNFDLDKTIYLFISGRYEVFNKGIDMYVASLARLNALLKQEGSETTVIAFIITNGETAGPNIESLKGREITRDLQRTVTDIVDKISGRIFEAASRGNLIDTSRLFSEDDAVKLKGSILNVNSRTNLPPIVTHNMINPNDEIIQLINHHHLLNDDSDRVKIIYHPEFLTRLSPLIPLDYTQFVRGCNLGVFPSYYEPWGYTPAECTVMGVPSITSNLTGFANYMSRRVEDADRHGLFIVDRQSRTFAESTEQIANVMWRFCQLSRRARINMRNRTERLSHLLSWTILNEQYESARTLAIDRAYGKKAV